MVMAVIGGQLAHPIPQQNYCNGLVQPSLIMNHHAVDGQEDIHPILAANISKFEDYDTKMCMSLNVCSCCCYAA